MRHSAPSAAANRNIDERHLRSRILQSQWSDEHDRQHRIFLDRQASQTAAVINAANAAREDMHRRLSQPGECITQAAARTASLAHLLRPAHGLRPCILRAYRLRLIPRPRRRN